MITKGNIGEGTKTIIVNTEPNRVNFKFFKDNEPYEKQIVFNSALKKCLIIPFSRLQTLVNENSDNKECFYIKFYGYPNDESYRFCSLKKLDEIIMETKDPIFHFYLNKINIVYFVIIEKDIISSVTFIYNKNEKKGIQPDKLQKFYKTEVKLPLIITKPEQDYFDLYYDIVYKDKNNFPNNERRKKRIYYNPNYFEKVKYFLINSTITIKDELLNQLTSQIYSTENINEMTVNEIIKKQFEYVLFDTEDEEDEKKFKTIIGSLSDKNIQAINSLVINLSEENDLIETIEYFVKDSSNKILIYKLGAFLSKYKDFDITQYDYFSKALYNE